MSINILEKVQQNLGYPALQKIDPNTQHVTIKETEPSESKLSQAAISAVLTGFYKYVQSDEGASIFLRGENSPSWVDEIFADSKKTVIQIVSTYAKNPEKDTLNRMNSIAQEVVKTAKENLPAPAAGKDVKLFFSHQKNNILLYLPAELNMGELLHDTTLDDKTNKMEGPISNLVKNIGSAFTKPVADEEIKTP